MITCKEYTDLRKQELKKEIQSLDGTPKLVVIQVGDNPSSNSYIKGKKKDCEEVGIICEHIKYDADISEDDLFDKIMQLNYQKDVHGIIVQLPLPDHINTKEIQDVISKSKDVDGFKINSSYEACTPLGAINYLKYLGYKFEGKNACVVGRSDIVGKPLAKMLLDLNCTVTICHSKTPEGNLMDHMFENDIVFTCTNQIEQFDYRYFSQQSDIIDFGIGIGLDGKLHGNICGDTIKTLKGDSDENRIIVSGLGGTGLLTRLALLENTVKAYKNYN